MLGKDHSRAKKGQKEKHRIVNRESAYIHVMTLRIERPSAVAPFLMLSLLHHITRHRLFQTIYGLGGRQRAWQQQRYVGTSPI